METLGEAELVERTLKGDRDAFTKLYSAHQSRIYSALLYRTRSREDAEDLLQTTFMRAYLGLSGFRGESAFSTWLMQIAMNVCTTYHRSEQSRRARADVVGKEDAWLRELWEPASIPDPEAFTMQEECRTTVEDEIRGLPDPYRNVTELRYLQDRTYLEIVEELNVPVGTVKTWLYRARQQLKDRLGERDVMAM